MNLRKKVDGLKALIGSGNETEPEIESSPQLTELRAENTKLKFRVTQLKRVRTILIKIVVVWQCLTGGGGPEICYTFAFL